MPKKVVVKTKAPTCVSALRGHSGGVSSVAFHPSAPYLATSSGDWTAMFVVFTVQNYLLSAEN
jgi:hypothetical protein